MERTDDSGELSRLRERFGVLRQVVRFNSGGRCWGTDRVQALTMSSML